MQAQFIFTSSIAIPRKVLNENGGFSEENKLFNEDVTLWAKLAARYPVAYSGFPTVNYDRTVPNQATSANSFAPRIIGTGFPLSLREELSNNRLDFYTARSVKLYAENYIFHCLLYYANSNVNNRNYYIEKFTKPLKLDEWIFSKRINKIIKNPDRLVWKIKYFLKVFIQSRAVVSILGGKIKVRGILYESNYSS